MGDGEVVSGASQIREIAAGLRRLARTLTTRPATQGFVENSAADLERLADEMSRASEDTQPLMVSPGMIVCTRCGGDGEVLDV